MLTFLFYPLKGGAVLRKLLLKLPLESAQPTHNPRLHSDELLIALSIAATTNPVAELAMKQLSKLKGAEGHSTVILPLEDANIFRKLGVNMTCDAQYHHKKLYHKR